jgi:hypothetical protein
VTIDAQDDDLWVGGAVRGCIEGSVGW